jgi:hypothetical protein
MVLLHSLSSVNINEEHIESISHIHFDQSASAKTILYRVRKTGHFTYLTLDVEAVYNNPSSSH